MKFNTSCFAQYRRKGLAAIFSVAAISFAPIVASAQIVTLIDNNSVARIDTAGAGMFDWSVDGQDQLEQQWFWYRVGQNAEAPISSISAPVNLTPTLRHLTTTYANPLFSVQVDYVLTGGAFGSGQSDVGESILIRNFGTSPLDFHFFQYSDFDLGGTPGNDSVQLGKNISGTRFNEALQWEPGISFTETVTVPGAHHGEAALFPVTLVKLNDAFPSVLSDVVGPVGAGDVTWAFQWDLVIPAGGSALISKDKYLEVLVPEPSSGTVCLLGLGLLLTSQWFRRRIHAQ